MMKELDYINKLAALWPTEGETSGEALALADEAVRTYPNSAKLWCMRGDLIQLGSEDISYSLEDALACYEKAVSIDPNFAEGHEEIGHFCDAVIPNPTRARRAFREAARIRQARISNET
ncbi:MAG TPA: tetratricopeptide repeat protein [Pyrinomonadaceae bacterium]|nr:tetratricopeptide repeat protein [Pyrinomonadaceae bacterium]